MKETGDFKKILRNSGNSVIMVNSKTHFYNHHFTGNNTRDVCCRIRSRLLSQDTAAMQTLSYHKRLTICLLLISAFLVVTGVALFAASYLPFEIVKPRIDSYALSGSADRFTIGLFRRIAFNLRITAIVAVIAGGLLLRGRKRSAQYIFTLFTRSIDLLKWFLRHIREAVRKEDKSHRYAFLIILLTAVAARLHFLLFKPMTADEAVTFYAYALKPLFIGLTNYSSPNNHIFHTFLVHISHMLFGSHPWAVRMPAFVAGVLVVPASYVVIRIFYNKHAALLTAAFTASSMVLIEYSTLARGYTLICLIFLFILALAAYLKHGGDPAVWLFFAVSSAIGFYTIPIMLYPFGIVVTWLFLSAVFETAGVSRRRLLRDLSVYVSVTGVLTLILYAPVFAVSGIKSIVANPWVISKPWSYFITEFPLSLQSLWNEWNTDVPYVISLLMASAFFVALVFHKRLSVYPVPIAAATLIWCIPVLTAQRVTPYNRVWLFLFPIYAGYASAGIVFLLSRVKPWKQVLNTVVYPILAVTLAAGLSLNVKLPFYSGKVIDNEPIALFLKGYLRPGDRVVDFAGNEDPDPSMIYYFKLHKVPLKYLISDIDSCSRILVIINEKKDTLKGRLEEQGIQLSEYTSPRLIKRYRVMSLYEMDRLNGERKRLTAAE